MDKNPSVCLSLVSCLSCIELEGPDVNRPNVSAEALNFRVSYSSGNYSLVLYIVADFLFPRHFHSFFSISLHVCVFCAEAVRSIQVYGQSSNGGLPTALVTFTFPPHKFQSSGDSNSTSSNVIANLEMGLLQMLDLLYFSEQIFQK